MISATNQDLPVRIAEVRFREDLLYRLNVVTIEVPPLRSRTEDISLLAEHIVSRLARKYEWPAGDLSAGARSPHRNRGRATSASWKTLSAWRHPVPRPRHPDRRPDSQ